MTGTAPGGFGLVTPYADLSLAGEEARRYRLGGRFEVGPSFSVSLEGERREAQARALDYGAVLRGSVSF